MNLGRYLLSRIVFIIIRIISFSYRFRVVNPEQKQIVLEQYPSPHYIYGLWHQNLISAIFYEVGHPHAVVVSSSKDGELVAVTCELLGNKAARGSSRRGGVEAMKAMLRFFKEGYPGAITVDGPKGPVYEPKKGIFELAKLAQIPVLPLTAIPDRYWVIEKSWDQFRIPKPFATITIFYGEPIHVHRNDSTEILDQYCSVLKSQLQKGEKKLIDLIRHDNSFD